MKTSCWPQIKTFYLGRVKIYLVVGVFMTIGLIKIPNAMPIDLNALDFTYFYFVS